MVTMCSQQLNRSGPLKVLPVGNHEEDFFLIREILERNRSLLAPDLEHARSLEEGKELMCERRFGLSGYNII